LKDMSQVEQYFFITSAAAAAAAATLLLFPSGEVIGGTSPPGAASAPTSIGSALICGVAIGELLFSCTRFTVGGGSRGSDLMWKLWTKKLQPYSNKNVDNFLSSLPGCFTVGYIGIRVLVGSGVGSHILISGVGGNGGRVDGHMGMHQLHVAQL